MKAVCFLVISILSVSKCFSQNATSNYILSSNQIKKLFANSLRKEFKINYPIFRVYKYTDQSGEYYCILTESRDSIGNRKDTLNYNIRAISLKFENGKYSKNWEINDQAIKNGKDEQSIWFWTKYSDFKDFDNDRLVEPLIVYGTWGANGYDDGRIKILIYYKGQKIAIRHQNGVLDFERETQIDKSFYSLPQSIQTAIKQKIELIIKSDQAIFPSGWQLAMKNQKTIISEKKQ